ncbi:hypothetical protein IE81DRAFT_246190 [Ceraceosorus guamensis]|uniref:Uncharacterized protein n=1 Tax=Ceraceosorus guamensis TaxID=1522189 RepID=A0A316VR19_9BASI|nr:hypothetical protein IE81DRAFT_246190 [Ceraceosorus guamensis]PWN40057.1 hypothetical protein IE81DRAFT_246190 [Ceraceosorus guamensis]
MHVLCRSVRRLFGMNLQSARRAIQELQRLRRLSTARMREPLVYSTQTVHEAAHAHACFPSSPFDILKRRERRGVAQSTSPSMSSDLASTLPRKLRGFHPVRFVIQLSGAQIIRFCSRLQCQFDHVKSTVQQQQQQQQQSEMRIPFKFQKLPNMLILFSILESVFCQI